MHVLTCAVPQDSKIVTRIARHEEKRWKSKKLSFCSARNGRYVQIPAVCLMARL